MLLLFLGFKGAAYYRGGSCLVRRGSQLVVVMCRSTYEPEGGGGDGRHMYRSTYEPGGGGGDGRHMYGLLTNRGVGVGTDEPGGGDDMYRSTYKRVNISRLIILQSLP